MGFILGGGSWYLEKTFLVSKTGREKIYKDGFSKMIAKGR